jgi:hypothetical protein
LRLAHCWERATPWRILRLGRRYMSATEWRAPSKERLARATYVDLGPLFLQNMVFGVDAVFRPPLHLRLPDHWGFACE